MIPIKYDRAEMTKSGIIRLSTKIRDKLYKDIFVDSTGKQITQQSFSRYRGYNFDFDEPQKGKYLLVSHYDENRYKSLEGLIDLEGNPVLPPMYDEILIFSNGQGFIVEQNHKFGILDKNGNVVVPVVLDNVFYQRSDYGRRTIIKNVHYPVQCQLGDDYFYVMKDGNILPFVTGDRINFNIGRKLKRR